MPYIKWNIYKQHLRVTCGCLWSKNTEILSKLLEITFFPDPQVLEFLRKWFCETVLCGDCSTAQRYFFFFLWGFLNTKYCKAWVSGNLIRMQFFTFGEKAHVTCVLCEQSLKCFLKTKPPRLDIAVIMGRDAVFASTSQDCIQGWNPKYLSTRSLEEQAHCQPPLKQPSCYVTGMEVLRWSNWLKMGNRKSKSWFSWWKNASSSVLQVFVLE